MKILQINPDFPPFVRGGGTEVFRLLAEEWHKQGHEVTVLASAPIGELKKYKSKGDLDYLVKFFGLVDPPRGFKEATYYFPMTLRSFCKLRKWISENQDSFDLIVVHGFVETMSMFPLLAFKKQVRNRLILTHHGIPTAEYNRLLSSFSKLLYASVGRIVLSRVNKILVFSKQSRDDLIKYCGFGHNKKIELTEIGIDTSNLEALFYKVKDRQLTLKKTMSLHYGIKFPFILSIGRIVKTKGYDILIDAFYSLKDRYPELNLVIAGDYGAYGAELMAYSAELGIRNRVIFTGRVSEEEKIFLMTNCSVFVIPSRREGFGINFLEAAIMNIRTVATITGAHPDIFSEDMRNARLVPPGQQSELADSISELLSGQPGILSFNEELAQKYDIRRLVEWYCGYSAEYNNKN